MIVLLTLISTLFIIQLFLTCSKPLESPFGNDQIPPDTVVIIDTLRFVDTTEIIVPDTGGAQMLCARLNSHRKEIVWMFRNEEGIYHLDFRAATESDNPSRMLVIDIDGQQFLWRLDESLEYVLEHDLEQDAIMRITSIPPHAFGQAIDICLIIETL